MKNIEVLEMTPELFKFRRKVMGMLYEVRDILGLDVPYMKIRIVRYLDDKDGLQTLGQCTRHNNLITLSEKLIKCNDDYIFHVVAHELGHGYLGLKHIETCPLMCALVPKKPSKAKVIAVLKKHRRLGAKKEARRLYRERLVRWGTAA